MVMASWTAHDLPSQAGRTVIVTGANSGIGMVTAAALAGAGARVVLAVRDPSPGSTPRPPSPVTEVKTLDLADLSSVHDFAADFHGPIDVLINNAGVHGRARGRTMDGFESQTGTNHLGHFALTNLLLPQSPTAWSRCPPARTGGFGDLTDLNWRKRRTVLEGVRASQLSNLLFTLELESRLEADSSPPRVRRPSGYAATNLQSGLWNKWADRLIAVANRIFAQSEEMGALPTLFAATQDLPGASYVGPDGRSESRGHPTLVGRTAAASSVALAEKLWTASEQLTGVEYPRSALVGRLG